MKCLVEITRGWDGESIKSETIYDDPPVNTSPRDDGEVFLGFGRRSSDWIEKNKIGPKDNGYWRIMHTPSKNSTKFIIDYGSWTHFGRVTITDEPEKTQKHRRPNMSKKKPYSKVRNAKLMRDLERKFKAINKKICAKDVAPDWYRRLVAEWVENYGNLIKLNDFLYVTEVEGGDTRFTDEALKLAVCDRKLLVKQEKVMLKFVDVLTERVNHGYCNIVGETCKTKCSCKNHDDKADAKATTADAKGTDEATAKKVAKEPAKKAVKKSAK